ncbi:MAG TPA: hypothetical protein VN962_13930 [Polyangia bacterium]|nr:hypothetical protein [Polyangia bacterium]
MRLPNGSRLRMVTLMLGLMVGGGGLLGCHKTAPEPTAQAPAAAPPAPEPPSPPLPPGPPATPQGLKDGLAKVKSQFDGLQHRSADLAKQIEDIPSDLQGYPQLRAAFYAFEEARGVTDAKVTLLSGRVDAAVKSGKPEELQQASQDIARASLDASLIDQQYIKLLHGAMAYERAAERQKEPVAASNAAPAPAKAKPAKSKH